MQLQDFRQRYLNGEGKQVTDELHALTIDQLVDALKEIGISHPRSHGRPKALEKAARYVVHGRKH